MDAAWTLTNIASGKQEDTHLVVDCGAIRPLLYLATSVVLTPANEQLRLQQFFPGQIRTQTAMFTVRTYSVSFVKESSNLGTEQRSR